MSCARAGAQCRARPRLEALRAARRRRRSLRDADLLLQLPLPLQQHPLHADLRPGWVPYTKTPVRPCPTSTASPPPPARPPSPRTPTLLGPIRPSCTLRSPLLFCCEAGGGTGAIAGWRAKQQSFQQARKDYSIKKCVPPRAAALFAHAALHSVAPPPPSVPRVCAKQRRAKASGALRGRPRLGRPPPEHCVRFICAACAACAARRNELARRS